MVNYMVAVDGSSNAKAAFFTAHSMMHPETDHLYIIHVQQDIVSKPSMEDIDYREGVQDLVNKRSTAMLVEYGKLAKERKIDYACMLATSNHVGSMICSQVEEKKIDFLIMGTRGLTPVKRIFVGSNSQYCVNHAHCNVLIVKGNWGPAESHVDTKTIVAQEEAERKARIQDDKDPRKHEAAMKLAEQLSKLAVAANAEYHTKHPHKDEAAPATSAATGASADHHEEQIQKVHRIFSE